MKEPLNQNKMKAKLVKTQKGYYLDTGKFDGIHLACYPHDVTKQRLSLKNCQAIERGYDLEELAKNWVFELNGHKWSNNDDTAGDNYGSFMAGAKTILAIFMDKKFSHGQLLNAMDLVWEWVNGEEYGCETLTEVQDKHIQSLKQTEWDVIVEMECVIGCQNLILNGENSVCCGDKKPKIADGCLILKRI